MPITNCIIIHRKGDGDLFVYNGHAAGWEVNLDGYAIIPKEEYEALCSAQEGGGDDEQVAAFLQGCRGGEGA